MARTQGPLWAWQVRSVDSTRVVSQARRMKRRTLDQSKGLTDRVAVERRSTFSGFVGRLKRGQADPLILQGLLAKFGAENR